MRRGFIERIEEDNVYVVFENDVTEKFNINQFSSDIQEDMIVEIDMEDQIKVFPPSEELREEIKEITKRIFVSFKDRRKK